MKSNDKLQDHNTVQSQTLEVKPTLKVDDLHGIIQSHMKKKICEGENRICSGVIIHGPSGSGKSMLAKWLPWKCRKFFQFITVPCAELVHKVVGETEKRISQIFQTARKMAPCFILLDNLEAVLGSTESMNSSFTAFSSSRRTDSHVTDRVLSNLLMEIDGINAKGVIKIKTKENLNFNLPSVVVIATVEKLEYLDRALRRPGRLEEHICLSFPNIYSREMIVKQYIDNLLLKYYTQSKKFNTVDKIDIDNFSKTSQITINSSIFKNHDSSYDLKAHIHHFEFSVFIQKLCGNPGNDPIFCRTENLNCLSISDWTGICKETTLYFIREYISKREGEISKGSTINYLYTKDFTLSQYLNDICNTLLFILRTKVLC